MPQLDIVENFADGTILTQAQLHQAFLGVEDFVNLIKLDEENIQAGSLTSQSIADNSIVNGKYQTGSISVSKLAQDVIDKLVPTGSVQAFAGTAVPSGWLYCDGTAVSRTVYSGLFSVVGIAWGNGDGSSTFNLPDIRGRFLRGQDDGTARDIDASSRTAISSGGSTGDNVGSFQDQAFLSHTHNNIFTDPGHVHQYSDGGHFAGVNIANGGNISVDGQRQTSSSVTGIGYTNVAEGQNETRPMNAYIRYIVKI